MKQLRQIILILACVLSVSTVYAQEGNADQLQKRQTTAGWEFAPVGAKWYYYSVYGIKDMTCVKDTVIGGQVMQKIATYYQTLFPDSRKANPFENSESFFVCSQEDTLYVYNPETQDLDRLYVFNAEVGDTLTLDVPYYSETYQPHTTFRIRITEIGMKDIIGGDRIKYYRYDPLDTFAYDLDTHVFYDHAGGSGFFPEKEFLMDYDDALQCYFDPIVGELKFLYDCECGTYPWSIENTMQNKDEVQVFYSSDERQLFVQSATGRGACRTALFTDEGAKVMEFAGETADLSALSAGIYLVQVESLKGKEVLFKGKIQVK